MAQSNTPKPDEFDDLPSEREVRGDDPQTTTEQDKNARTGREQPKPNATPDDEHPAGPQETSQTTPGVVPPASDQKPGKGAKVFKSFYSGLSVSVNEKDENGNLVTRIIARFFPYAEHDAGDIVRRGYLVTDDKRVFERLKDDPMVEEISASDHQKAMKKATPLGYPQS